MDNPPPFKFAPKRSKLKQQIPSRVGRLFMKKRYL